VKRHKSGKLRTFVANWKAFRISKTDLKIRPIYHRLQHRIETHICISFVAYKVYKELERQLKELQSNISPEKAIEIAKTIYQVKANTQNREVSHILLITDEQKNLAQIFSFGWPSVEVRKNIVLFLFTYMILITVHKFINPSCSINKLHLTSTQL